MTKSPPAVVAGQSFPKKASRQALVGGKGSVFYRAHSYHTKVPVEALTHLVEHYTEPGDTIVDPFCGSGMTGVAALLTGRRAVLSDLSPAAVHIARGYTTKVDPEAFRTSIAEVLGAISGAERDLYLTDAGKIEYTVWSDVVACPTCDTDTVVWDAAVDLEESTVSKTLRCPNGHDGFTRSGLQWRASIPVHRNLSTTGSRTRVRQAADRTEEGLERPLSDWYPTAPWEPWREMWRAQHREMSVETSADFYTARNLVGLASLWRTIDELPDPVLRNAMRFAFTSIVNRASRRYQWHPKRPTNVLSSTMYIAPLNYEFNVFSLFRRKVETIARLYEATWNAPGSCEVHQGSATDLSWLADGSADYVFADPPFGSNIFYGDSSFLWEAWLGEHTDIATEAVVNKRVDAVRGGTNLDGYRALIENALNEMVRVGRTTGWISLQFHNTNDAVWSSIQQAIEDAELHVETAVVMDKKQASFKGLRHQSRGERVANFDLVMHLRRRTAEDVAGRSELSTDDVATIIAEHLETAPPSQRTTPFLHSVVMRTLLERGASLDGWSFRAVEELLVQRFTQTGERWTLPPETTRTVS